MPRVRVFHTRAGEAGPLVDAVRSAGYEVDYDEQIQIAMRNVRSEPPLAAVIDLTRLPSHGREVATGLRGLKVARHVPIVFVDGEPEKVEAIRRLLPDAVYTSRTRLRSALKQALKNPPAAPVVPTQMMDRYAGRSAAQKLGIRENDAVAVIDPPRDYEAVLGEMPAGVTFEENPRKSFRVTLWFIHDADAYLARLPRMRSVAAGSKLWVIWPKGTQKSTGITQNLVRESAIEMGLVDYKICAVNEAWSAIAFAQKKT